jgi:hypothetical protein
MICFFVLLITLQSQSTHRIVVTSEPHVPARYLTSTGAGAQQNAPANACDTKNRLADFAIAVQIAIQSLGKETFFDEEVPKIKLPASVESISILDAQGKVKDSTISDFINKTYHLPSSTETKEGEYYIQSKTTSGIRWILIKTKEQ